jgi:hypothetical protein
MSALSLCVLKGEGRCEGGVVAHHVIAKARIRDNLGRGSEIAEHAVTDPRNLVWLCRLHHERLHTWAFDRCRVEPSAEVYDFAADYSLGWCLP